MDKISERLGQLPIHFNNVILTEDCCPEIYIDITFYIEIQRQTLYFNNLMNDDPMCYETTFEY